MATDGNYDDTLRLSFRLSRFQRLVDPVDGGFRILIISALWIGFTVAFGVMTLLSSEEFVLIVLILTLNLIGWWIICGRWLRVHMIYVFGNEYVNIIEINEKTIQFGFQKAEYVIQHCNRAVISKGLLDTYIIRLANNRRALVIPKNCVTAAQLKEYLSGGI